MPNRAEVYAAVDSERDYQDKLVQNPERSDGSSKSVGDYILMLEEYVQEARSRWNRNAGNGPALDSIRKVAGIAVHCMEDHDAPHRGAPPEAIAAIAAEMPTASFDPYMPPTRSDSYPEAGCNAWGDQLRAGRNRRVGGVIYLIRKEKHMRQGELAVLAGLKQPNLSRIENGQVSARPATLEKIARALGVETKEFYNESRLLSAQATV